MRKAGQTALTGLLCGLMAVPQAAFAQGPPVPTASARMGHPEPGAPEAPKPPKRAERVAPLTQQERVLHVLNRFTFGPRPGEVEEVQKMGAQAWFLQQLQPEKIDDSAFEQRMQEYPALKLSQDELMKRFPSQQMIRMSDRRDLPIPRGRVEHALYADARYEFDQKQNEMKEQALNGAKPGQAQQQNQQQAQQQNQQQSMMMAGNPQTENSDAAAGPNAKAARRQQMAGLKALGQTEGESTPPVTAIKPPVRTGHPDSGMQASMGMAGGGAADMNGAANGNTPQGNQLLSNGEMATEPLDLNKKGKPRMKELASTPANKFAGDPGAEPAPEEVQAVLALPAEQRVQRLVEMKPDEMMSFKAALKPQQKVLLVQGMSPEDEEVAGEFITAPERVVGAEILEERMSRDVFSERQLQAVMTDFWLNHFSVYLRKNANEPYYLPAYERDVILPNALGSFENLLVAVAQSPAMLMYLDNWESVGPNSLQAQRAERAQLMRPLAKKQQPKGINENYGRELMELHTLGVNGGYTQQDVIEVSKCFTGWTIDKPFQGGGAFYDEARHEPGTKIVLGHKIKENGQKEGLEVLHILATSPATAHFISQKLAVRFVSDDPPAALVNRMAATFLKTNGNIKAVLLTMYRSPEFWSPQVYRAKLKTPVEFMASALRASGADVKSPLPLVQAMDRLGMPIYGMLTPQGYSWKADEWVSSNALISRMNFALVLSSNRVGGTKTDWPRLLGDSEGAPPLTPDVETENKLEMALLGEPASDKTRSTVLAQFGDPTAQQSAEEAFKAKPATQSETLMVPADGGFMPRFNPKRPGRERPVNVQGTPLDTMAGLLLGSPEFQRR
ncbi:MAG TPA: DUF1800 family protein [Acidobacteriaceae bacterium]|nr:DUF1800 family protein [Acidobacteriaceae bacterium]